MNRLIGSVVAAAFALGTGVAYGQAKEIKIAHIYGKTGALEDADSLKRRIEQAAKYVPLEDLCLSPQCGFSSTHHGNKLSEDEQWRKLERVVKVAKEVWQ